MLTPLHKQSDSISDIFDMRALREKLYPSSGTFWGDLNKRNLLASGARLAVPAAGAGIGALLNAVRGKSIARGAGVGALTGAGLNLGADVGSVVGGIPAQAAGGELAAFAGPGVGSLAGGAGGGYGGYQLGQSLFGPEEEKRDGDGDGTINEGTPEEKEAADQPADQTPRHDCQGVHPDQTHEEWKASVEKEASTSRRFYIDVTPDLVKYAQYTRKSAAFDIFKQGPEFDITRMDGPPPTRREQAAAEREDDMIRELEKDYNEAMADRANESQASKDESKRLHREYLEMMGTRDDEEKEASTARRFYIDVTPDLVKYAQDKRTMRKIAGLYYKPTTAQPALTANQLRYNANAARIVATGVAGIGIGGLASLVQYLRHPDAMDQARKTTEVAPALAVPTRKHTRRKPEDEETEEQLAKTAGDGGILGDENWQWPPLVAGTMAAGYGGYKLTHALGRYLAGKKRKRTREQALAEATEDYEAAIAEQFEGSKEASISGNLSDELNVLHIVFDKAAGISNYSIRNVPIIQRINDMLPSNQQITETVESVTGVAKKSLGMYAGVLTALAGAAGVPAAMVAYGHARKQRKSQTPLAEAMRRRRTELARRRPAPIYITPGEEIVHEEDDPAIESV